MPRLAANLTLLFRERPWPERFDAAAAAGFAAVEILFPHELPEADIRAGLARNGLELALFNAPPPAADGSLPDLAVTPGAQGAFRDAMTAACRRADRLGAGLIHVMSGHGAGAAAEACLVDNLRWLADARPDRRFTIEPLNPADRPGYFLDSYERAARILDRVNRANVGLQYDSYHAQRIHGDALAVWASFGPRAFHVQIGQAPDRREPGPGPVDFAALFDAIAASGYGGLIAAEYLPSTPRTEDSLGWMAMAPRTGQR